MRFKALIKIKDSWKGCKSGTSDSDFFVERRGSWALCGLFFSVIFCVPGAVVIVSTTFTVPDVDIW